MFAFTNLQAQNYSGDFCLTPPLSQGNTANSMLTVANNVLDDPLTPLVLNVRITVFNDLLGNNYFSDNNMPFGENEFMEIIKNLNLDFNSKNIFFKFLGYSYHNCDFADLTNANRDYAHNAMNTINEHDAININFVNSVDTVLGIPTPTACYQIKAGYVATLGVPTIIISMPRFNEVKTYESSNFQLVPDKVHLISHDMGHVLGIDHPGRGAENQNNAATPCEHVTRNPNDILYNATTTGDLIADTPAQKLGYAPYDYYKLNDQDPYFFQYDGTLKPKTGEAAAQNYDCAGTLLDFLNIKYGNLMVSIFKYDPDFQDNYPTQITPYFTDGQYQAMRNYIISPNSSSGVGLGAAITNVNSLYQTFRRTDIIGNQILSTTDLGNGLAEVCRGASQSFTFQRGFHYEFPGDEGSVPTSVGPETTPFLAQPGFNCPVTILELVPGKTNLATNTGEAPTICRYRVCTTEPFVSGFIYSTEVLGSMHITVEELDAIQVKDPRLYDELMQHYYYIIKKTTATGAETHETIYKN